MATTINRSRENSKWSAKILKKQVIQFLDNTSIHGIKYFSERRPPLEMILWIIAMIFSLVTCGILISKAWELRSSSPVFLAMNKTQQAVWEVPFPAVTLCPNLKLNDTNVSKEDLKCASNLFCEYDVKCNNISQVMDFIEKNSLTLNDIFPQDSSNQFTIYLGNEPQSIIKRVLTDNGICYSFNMIPGLELFKDNTYHLNKGYLNYNESMQWNDEDGYRNPESDSVYPRRAFGPGADAGMLMVLKSSISQFEQFQNSEEDGVEPCSYTDGFQIKLHNPSDLPNGGSSYYVTANSQAQISVKPQRMMSDDEIKSYSAAQRQCYYPKEKDLQFFKVYTQSNCQQDCLSRIALNCCGCVGYYMPRNASTPICFKEDEVNCLYKATDKMLAANSRTKFEGFCTKMDSQCDCLPTCSLLEYESHLSQTGVNAKSLRKVLIRNGVNVEDGYDYTVVEIFYNHAQFVPFRRMEQYGTVEFLANIGGVLGLCLGMSVLSVVELLYWMLVRPWFSPRKRLPKQEEGTHLQPS